MPINHSCNLAFFRSLKDLQEEKINKVVGQLITFTHRMFRVETSAEVEDAVAIPCEKKILISNNYLLNDISIHKIAGTLAHEWGHLCDDTLICGFPTKQSEYSADAFGAYFLAKHNYLIEPEIETVTQGPETKPHLYGTHEERAQHLRNSYYKARYTNNVHPYTLFTPLFPSTVFNYGYIYHSHN